MSNPIDPLQRSLFDLTQESKKQALSPVNDETRDRLLLSVLAVGSVKGVGFRSICLAWDADILTELLDKSNNGLKSKVLAITENKRIDLIKAVEADKSKMRDDAKRILAELDRQHMTFVPIGHKDYPSTLLKLSEPPRWIFIKGEITQVNNQSIIGVVGTRTATSRGLKLAYQTGFELAKRNITVLSGLAKGIDESAHRGTVDCFGQSIAILGHGILTKEATYDQSLLANLLEYDGCLVSEYLPYDPPSRFGFLRRNELQAALSKVIIPIECPSLESGTGATIRRALNIGTPVVGVIPEGETEQSLLETKANLERLGLQVFLISPGNSKVFWEFLEKIIPEHDWSEGSEKRQLRFFCKIEKQILDVAVKLDIDKKSIESFAKRIEERLDK
jgi:DNA processing protein